MNPFLSRRGARGRLISGEKLEEAGISNLFLGVRKMGRVVDFLSSCRVRKCPDRDGGAEMRRYVLIPVRGCSCLMRVVKLAMQLNSGRYTGRFALGFCWQE